jgi:hypothetical protein
MLYNGKSDGNVDFIRKGSDELNKLYQYADLLEREKMIIL